MRRVVVIALAGFGLAGCSSFSMDAFKPTPPAVQVQFESVPSGADAITSVGPGCKTPCTLDVPAPDSGFTVTFNMNRFQPVTVPVQVIRFPGDAMAPPSTTADPNPVVVELRPAGPPPKAARKPPAPKKPKAAKGAAATPAAGSPFPNPQAPTSTR
jgi:hypothetical protein